MSQATETKAANELLVNALEVAGNDWFKLLDMKYGDEFSMKAQYRTGQSGAFDKDNVNEKVEVRFSGEHVAQTVPAWMAANMRVSLTKLLYPVKTMYGVKRMNSDKFSVDETSLSALGIVKWSKYLDVMALQGGKKRAALNAGEYKIVPKGSVLLLNPFNSEVGTDMAQYKYLTVAYQGYAEYLTAIGGLDRQLKTDRPALREAENALLASGLKPGKLGDVRYLRRIPIFEVIT